MAREASGSFNLNLAVSLRDTATTRISTPLDAASYAISESISTGTSNNQCDRQYSVVGSLAASATFDLDLAGSVTDGLGQTFTIVEIKDLVIENTGTAIASNGTIAYGAAGANPLSTLFGNTNDIGIIPPGALVALHSTLDGGGWAVTAGSADTLRLTNQSGSFATTFKIIVTGRSS